MRCPNCGASISENEEKCPYCDSFLDTKKKNINIEDIQREIHDKISTLQSNPDDKPNAFMIILSLITPIGILLFIINLMMERPKSAKACFLAAFITMFIFVFGFIIFGFFEMHSMSRSMPDMPVFFVN